MKRVLLLVGLMLLLAACLPGDGVNTVDDPAGFFWGVWHGWIAPISLIVSFFREDIAIYEVHNQPHWYDLGFYMAVISGFGGLRFFRRQAAKSEE